VSTDDCVVYDLSEKVWNFRFGTWRGCETGRADISFIRFELCVCFPFLLHSSRIVVLDAVEPFHDTTRKRLTTTLTESGLGSTRLKTSCDTLFAPFPASRLNSF